MGPLVSLMSDEMVQVRDSVAWTIGRVCEHSPKALLQEKYLIALLHSFTLALGGELRVAVNVCWVCAGDHFMLPLIPCILCFSRVAMAMTP